MLYLMLYGNTLPFAKKNDRTVIALILYELTMVISFTQELCPVARWDTFPKLRIGCQVQSRDSPSEDKQCTPVVMGHGLCNAWRFLFFVCILLDRLGVRF